MTMYTGAAVTFMAANKWYASIPNLKDMVVAVSHQQSHSISHLDSTVHISSSSPLPQEKKMPRLKAASSSSSRYDAVLLSTPVMTVEALHYLSTHISDVLLLTKPHSIAISTLNMGIPVFDSTVHLQYFLSRGVHVPHNNTQLIPGK